MSEKGYVKQYTNLIYKLKKKYEKRGLSKGTDLRKSVDAFQQWLLSSPKSIDSKTYFLLGINLLREMIDKFEQERNNFIMLLSNCNVFGCTPKEKDIYTSIVTDYNEFSQDIIGCTDKGFSTILKILQKTKVSQKAREYLERECIELGSELKWLKSN